MTDTFNRFILHLFTLYLVYAKSFKKWLIVGFEKNEKICMVAKYYLEIICTTFRGGYEIT